jgi:gamma-glutamyltranspeptidase / glutathione hydrolase
VSTRSFRKIATEGNPFYPRLLGRRGAVACHHYLAADAAADILKDGGNAVDGAVAAILVESLVNPQMFGLGGECPMLIRMADEGRVRVVNGNTVAPERATPQTYLARGHTIMPDEGILAAGVPAALGALLTALLWFGRLSFDEVSAPALMLARDGFPAHGGLLNQERFGLRDLVSKFRREWPGSAAVYLPGGDAPQEGALIRNPGLAALLEHLRRAEQRATGDRVEGLRGLLHEFYRGEPAIEIVKFSAERDGLLERSDLAAFETYVEDPVSLAYQDSTLFKCGFWNQGPALLQTLAILECWDLATLGHNSADYLHLLIEATKLAYADREQWYGDPRQVKVPSCGLLSGGYAGLRAALIDTGRADGTMRPGDPRGAGRAILPVAERLGGANWGPGTVHVDVIDAAGSLVSATPSGGWLKSAEVMPALGFPLGNRLMTFYLGPAHHPNLLAPFKRPRTTISPSLCLLGDQPWMVFGSMGGDQQDQWQLQFFLNRIVFNMTVQEAIEAPKLSSEHFPGFFAPHDRFPNRVRAEPRLGDAVLGELARRGHDIDLGPDWSEGFLLAAARDPATGVLEAGCDPRGAKAEVFPICARCW